ncbi:MAG: 50S ribosomal protein L10 [Chloroflexi bacterium]|nr:50S ribosomal protein L10 [Chloroflexota bacterium]
MAITKERKQDLVQQYIDMLENAQGVVITEYRGMTVKQLDELRGKLREKNSQFTVTKNTLLKIALNEVGMAIPDDMLKGPVALAVAFDDLPSTVKTVLDYGEDNEIFVVKGGIMGASVIAEKQLEPLSEMPPLEVLRAQILGMATMPLTQFVGLLEEPGRQVVAVIRAATDGLVNVLAAYSQKEDAA